MIDTAYIVRRLADAAQAAEVAAAVAADAASGWVALDAAAHQARGAADEIQEIRREIEAMLR